MAVEHRVIGEEEAGQRLDRWFRRTYPGLGQGALQRLLRKGQIRVDGKRAKADQRLETGQSLRIPPLPTVTEKAARSLPRAAAPITQEEREALRTLVLYRDDDLLALNKPPGLSVQGGSGVKRHLDGLLEALRFEAKELPRLVHRLDKDTSGLLLLARTLPAARALAEAFRTHRVTKLYWALTEGRPKAPQGYIDRPLQGASGEAQEAVTFYRQVGAGQAGRAWLVLSPVTGRKHQLRLHCAASGFPIVGDRKYGGAMAGKEDAQGRRPGALHLHAHALRLSHPLEGTTLSLTAPLPPHMAATWSHLSFDWEAGSRAEAALLEDLSHRSS